MQRAARTDEDPVQRIQIQQRFGAFYIYRILKSRIAHRLNANLLRAWIDNRDHADVRLDCRKRLHHGAGAKTVSDKADFLCHGFSFPLLSIGLCVLIDQTYIVSNNISFY